MKMNKANPNIRRILGKSELSWKGWHWRWWLDLHLEGTENVQSDMGTPNQSQFTRRTNTSSYYSWTFWSANPFYTSYITSKFLQEKTWAMFREVELTDPTVRHHCSLGWAWQNHCKLGEEKSKSPKLLADTNSKSVQNTLLHLTADRRRKKVDF